MKKSDLPQEKVFGLMSPQRLAKLRSVLEKRTSELTVVLENVHDPHNVSAVLRSCDAVGIMEVNLLYYDGQSFPKISNVSSSSAGKWLEIVKHDNVEECFSFLRKQGKKIYTTKMTETANNLYDMELDVPLALVFGNEHNGVSDQAFAKADGNFLIPQYGVVQSLNISVACAVTLYEVFRQRRLAGKFDNPQMPEEQINAILETWVRRERNL